MSDIVYLYGYVPARAAVDLDDAPAGIAGRPLELVDCGDVRAVVSRVPADAYSPERIEAGLADMSWLAEQGIAHERAVAALVDRSTVVPMRLFTLFSSTEALVADCAQRAAWLGDSIARLDGVRQWDLKVSFDAARMLDTIGQSNEEVAAIDAEMEAAAPGRRYLLQRQRDEVARGAVRRTAVALADQAFASLSGIARDSRRLPPPGSAEPDQLPVVLNAALLVERAREDELRDAARVEAERLGRHGIDVACSGPWAAYRFVGAP